MPLQIPAGYGQVLIPLRHSLLSRSAAITFGIRQDFAGFPTTGLVNDIQAAFTSNVTLDSNVTIGPTILRINLDGTEPVAVEGSTTTVGSSSTTSLPPNVAILARKGTLRGGRRGRGRMFIPWYVDEAGVDEAGNVSSSFQATAQTQLTDFLADLDTNETPMVLLHNSEGISAPGSPNPVVSLIIDPRVATQRRRLRS